MARHTVKFSTKTQLPVEFTDLVFRVWEDGERLGTLLISKGAVEWRSSRKQLKNRLSWSQLDDLFADRGRIIGRKRT